MLHSVISPQSQYPIQRNSTLLIRAAKYSICKALTDNPWAYGGFPSALRLCTLDHHVVIRRSSRSFVLETLISKIRQQLSESVLLLLQDRFESFDAGNLNIRRARLNILASFPLVEMRAVGFSQAHHTYWLCPIRVRSPEDTHREIV